MITRVTGAAEGLSPYVLTDAQMAAGSTLGSPKATVVIKATGAIEKLYGVDAGRAVLGTVMVHHWDARTGVALTKLHGHFAIHPHHQEHRFELSNGITVHEDIFVLSGRPEGDVVDPPAVYYVVELTNGTDRPVEVETYASAQLRGDTAHDVDTTYRPKLRAIMAWNASEPRLVRLFGASIAPTSHETTSDTAKASAAHFRGRLSGATISTAADPIGILHFHHRLGPGQTISFALQSSYATTGRRAAERVYRSCPDAATALERTRVYYEEILGRAVVLTPDADVNRGVRWAKTNMLRTEVLAATGWAVVNDPTRSNNSVGRDTAWFAFGSDYMTPGFSRSSLLWYATHLAKSGMVVEYYDIRNGQSADYGLNINDDTPLLILALWHHFSATGDRAFLEQVYPAARRAARFLISQRDARGLIWCSSTETAERGIAGWRNVIAGYRLSGATTELNSECYAALVAVSHMARVLGHHQAAAASSRQAEALRAAINTHLLDPQSGLYYLNIDVTGEPRTDVTADLVFPVMFGVADDETAANIVSRLSVPDFWTEAGIHTVPRDAIDYGPTHGHGLLGGVWVAQTFWFAFAAARFNPAFMAYALATSFRHYTKDPLRNNTVPGQFSEWLHGETLTNQGMMLSPWFPPRYLWAAIEGAAGLDLSTGQPTIHPRLAPEWAWLGVRNVALSGQRVTWCVARTPDLRMYATCRFEGSLPYEAYDDDVSAAISFAGEGAVAIGLRRAADLMILVGNTTDRTVLASLRYDGPLAGAYDGRSFNSLRGTWTEWRSFDVEAMARGMAIQVDRKGFCLLELRQET